MTSIWWIRRDLRLTDNPTLHAALAAGAVLPVFILDPVFAASAPRRKNFLHEGLHTLDSDLRIRGSYLVIRIGNPLDVLTRLLAETRAETIYAEEDFTPYARKRDAAIAARLPLQLISGQTAHHPAAILKNDGSPYTVYTPYAKAWKARLEDIHLLSAPERILTPSGVPSEPLPLFQVNPAFPAGEREALYRLDRFTNSQFTNLS